MSLTPEEKQRIEEEELLRAEIRKKIEAKEKAGKVRWNFVIAGLILCVIALPTYVSIWEWFKSQW